MTGRRRQLLAALAVALVAALAYHAVGAAIFLPRFRSEDPREVLVAYYEAQRWGYHSLAEQALDAEERESRHRPNYVQPLVKDAFLAADLEVSEAHDIGLYGENAEEVQFTVQYRSLWRNSIGEPPGSRYWFVYLGRDAGGSWHVLSEGTGP